MTTFDLTGLGAIVTGGSSGIGAAIAAAFVDAGASTAVVDVDDGAPPGTIFARADVGDDTSVRAAVGDLTATLGRLDILVNNAGIGAQGSVEDNDDDEWHRVYDINVVGLVRVSRAALPDLRQSNSASIVNVCSIAAVSGLPRRALYSATKGAVLALTRAMAADHLADGIRVNAVNPGTADTPWVTRLLAATADPAAELAALQARQPHGRLVTPAEVAAAVVYLASPAAGSTTGTSIDVDGGLAALRLPPR